MGTRAGPVSVEIRDFFLLIRRFWCRRDRIPLGCLVIIHIKKQSIVSDDKENEASYITYLHAIHESISGSGKLGELWHIVA